jgi:hypothetical protein
MAGTRAPGPQARLHKQGVCPSRTPGSLGTNDQADPCVVALGGDTPGPAGVNDYHPPRLIEARNDATFVRVAHAGDRTNADLSHSSSSAVIVGTGLASVARIPIPGTALYIELSPRGRIPKAGSTSALFIQDKTGKQVLRLDYGYNKASGQVDYHWNQKGTFAEFGIADHTPAGPGGEVLFKSARLLKYGGRVLLVVGVAADAYSIVVAQKRVRQVVRVAAGWAGADAGAYLGGEGGAVIGTMIEPGGGSAVGGIVGSIVFGIGGYFGASWATGNAYDWVEETYFQPLPLNHN